MRRERQIIESRHEDVFGNADFQRSEGVQAPPKHPIKIQPSSPEFVRAKPDNSLRTRQSRLAILTAAIPF